MANTTISANFYKLILASLKTQVSRRLEAEARELAEKIIAEEIATLTFSIEDLVSIDAAGHVLSIKICREEKKP